MIWHDVACGNDVADLGLLNYVKLDYWHIAFACIQMMLMDICTGVSTIVIQDLVLKVRGELRYLRKYKNYVHDFENERGKLLAELASVMLKIDEATKRNETLVDPRVKNWLERANELLQKDTKPTKYFGVCTDCFSQIALAKDLERWKKENIPNLIAEVNEFDAFAHAAGVPGMAFHLQEFMSFESREANFEELKKELEDEGNYMIGLQGTGGTGKSTMAVEVGKHVGNSNPFDRVIFITVSTPVEEKRIKDEIANQLDLLLEDEKLLTHAQQIWNRIASAGKVLIILDDVWEVLNLNNIGIQHRIHSKGRCCILLTTRYRNICTQMGCQKRIELEDLDEKDALNLFLSHATKSDQDCPNDLKNVAEEIVDECGRLPITVVAMAKTLKDWPPEEWPHALMALKIADKPSRHGIVDENEAKFYNSLKLSYTYLRDKEAQLLLLLCSIFPKAHEIPIELLSRIAIGMGLFGEVDKYHTTRIQVQVKKNKLINSSLLLKVGQEYVRMHDVIRKVALEIGNEEIQVIMDSTTKLEENMKYSSWIINGFPHGFDDSKLKVLLVWINTHGYLELPSTLFGRMKSLRVLLLHSKIEFGRTSAPSLPKSIESLTHIRTLSLTDWELGDISVLMKNLKLLESLELNNCSIIDLPNGICELHKLRCLCLIRCSLEKNTPFEVIAGCLQLEELYYVSNEDHMPIGTEIPTISSLPEYQIYHIDGSDFSRFDSSQLDFSIKKSFKPIKLQRIFSKEIIKSLATSAEILELNGDNEYGWNNLIPGIFPTEGGAMKNLIKLSLKDWLEMKCLIYTKHLQLKAGVTIFPKLAELQLVEVHVKEICCGRYPDGFLKQLEKLELTSCTKLQGTLFEAMLELDNLKSIEITRCSMTYLFHPSTAQSLRQLETLRVSACTLLKYIIWDDEPSVDLDQKKTDDKEPNPRSHDSMFPKLKLLSVKQCPELEFILPICFCEDLPLLQNVDILICRKLKYMFGQYPKERGLHQIHLVNALPSLKVMSIEHIPLFVSIYPECYLPQKSAAKSSEGSKGKDNNPSCNVSWGPLCCFLPKSKTTNKDETSTFMEANQQDPTVSQEKYVGNIAHGIFTPPLCPCNLREMTIDGILNIRSLFSVSIASSMSLLEKLAVHNSHNLEHIVIEEVDGYHHMNNNSIFPNLCMIEIDGCHKLESVFPASYSRNLVHLKSVRILRATLLKYVFGKSCGDDNSPHQNQNVEIHLPSLNKLTLGYLPSMKSVCPENYNVKASSLQDIALSECPQLPISSFIDLSIEGQKGQEEHSGEKLIGMELRDLKHLHLGYLDLNTIYDLERLEIASPVNSSLETLSIRCLNQLSDICVGPKNLHMNFQNLFDLVIQRCHNLKFILSASTSRSLPYLRHLDVSRCGELKRIIDDDDDQECCFPNLYSIDVFRCEKLECLFSISTCGSLPQLSLLSISEAQNLEQVFGRNQQGTTKELHFKQVFPKLFMIRLEDLPILRAICSGIDFKDVIYCQVENCPKDIPLTSTDIEFLDGYAEWLKKSESNEGNMDEDYFNEQFFERLREVAEKTVKRDRPMAKQNNGSSSIKEMAEASVEEIPISEAIKADEVMDSEQRKDPATFAAPLQAEFPECEGGLHLQSKPYDFCSKAPSSQEAVKQTSQEVFKLDEALRTIQIMNPESSKSRPTAFFVPSENEYPHDNSVCIEGNGKRVTLDHQVVTEIEPDIHLGDSEKNIEASVGETSNKIAMAIPSATTETSSPLIPSFSTPNNPQMATSSSETKQDSSSSDLSDTYITEPAQDEIKATQAETFMPYASKQLEDDELMRLFQIMEEGADMEVQMPCPSKTSAHEDDSEVTKALADMHALMRMGLNEIASSEKSKLCFENALNTLSCHCSHDGLKATIHSLQQQIQTILSSFKQAHAIIDTATQHEQKEKLMTGQRLQRKEAARALLYEISKTQNSMVEAQTREAELKEQISKFQVELYSKANEIKECEIKLSSLEEQKKKSVSDTIDFIKDMEAVKEERSIMVEDQIKARQQLERVDSKWSSCLANLRKTSMLLEVHLKHKF